MKIRNGFVSNSSSSSFIAGIIKTKLKPKDICVKLNLITKDELRKDAKEYKMEMDDLAIEILCDDGHPVYLDGDITVVRPEVMDIELDNTQVPISVFKEVEQELLEKYKELNPIEEISFCFFGGHR